jgi:two-component system NarL family sensor kinase
MIWRSDRGAELALAGLRAALLVVIFISEQLIDARQLAGSSFFLVLAIALAYSLAGILAALIGPGWAPARVMFVQPTVDVVLLSGLAYTSGGAFSDVRKAFFVIPLAAAFSERPRSTAQWSLLAVFAFTVQAVLAGGHPQNAANTWQRMTLNQDLYLAWTGAAAAMLALALRRRSAHTEQLAESRRRLLTQAIESVERERTRLADALHDVPVQNLIAARHDLRRAERTGDADSFERLRAAIDTTIAELREEIFNLHPHVLDHVGLRAALEQVAQRHARDTSARLVISIEDEPGGAERQVLFALGRELLANAVKHADAGEIRATVWRDAGQLHLEVRDDGRGIAPGRAHAAVLEGHIGLAAARERAGTLGGRLSIATSPGGGTAVHVTIPAPSRPDVSDRVTPADALRMSPA